jgi:hypothetical protein
MDLLADKCFELVILSTTETHRELLTSRDVGETADSYPVRIHLLRTVSDRTYSCIRSEFDSDMAKFVLTSPVYIYIYIYIYVF